MEYGNMCNKLDQGKQAVAQAVVAGNAARERAISKAAALKKESERLGSFKKLDKDKDGKLSKAEVLAYSKQVHSFDVPTDVLGKIMSSLEPITPDKFRRLHQKVA